MEGRLTRRAFLRGAATRPLEDPDVSLFDRERDPAERHDLGRDPALAKVRGELRERLVARIFPPDPVAYDWYKDIPPPPKMKR